MSKSRAFTLIELLVVIAVVAVLVSLLLPALAESRRSARNTHCLSNLRGVGVGVAAYRADHPLRFPGSWDDLGIDTGPATTCPADPNGGPVSYVLVDLNEAVFGPPLNAANLIDNPRPKDGPPVIASDGSWFRHGLRAMERLDPNPQSEQWRRTWRNKVFLPDGAARAMRGPLSGMGGPWAL